MNRRRLQTERYIEARVQDTKGNAVRNLGKSATVGIGILLACAIWAGCGSSSESPSQGGTLTGTYTAFPESLDPGLSFSLEGATALQNVYIPLLTYAHANGAAGTKLIPGLAKDLPRIDQGGRRFTLFLRPGLRYSDGTPVKASDFRFVVERLFRVNSVGYTFFTGIVVAVQFANTKMGGIPGIGGKAPGGRRGGRREGQRWSPPPMDSAAPPGRRRL